MDNKAKREYFTARCEKTQESFLVRLENHNGVWHQVKGYKIPENQGMGDAKDNPGLNITGGLCADETYSCPYCGATSWCSCPICGGKITCYDGSKFNVCAYCGRKGKVGGTAESINLSGRDGV